MIMNIFQNIKTPEQIRLEEEMAIAKKRGVSLEEYRALKKKEHEEECQRIHMEELKRLGITEEEYQERERKRIRKDKIIRNVKGIIVAICMLIVLFLMYYGIPAFLLSSEIGKDIFLIVGIIIVVGLVAFCLGTPVFLSVWAFKDRGKGNRYLTAIVVLILTLLVVGLVLYTCGSMGGGADIYEPGKLRPDKF